MKSYNIYKKYLYRISGGKYPTLYLLECKNQNPMEVIKEVQMPVPPIFARGEDIEYLMIPLYYL